MTDSTIALMLALFVNAAILIMAASVFHAQGRTDVQEIEQAYELLSPLLGAGIASTLFAVALLASGLNSTVTATLAGQIVMAETGFALGVQLLISLFGAMVLLGLGAFLSWFKASDKTGRASSGLQASGLSPQRS